MNKNRKTSVEHSGIKRGKVFFEDFKKLTSDISRSL